MCINEAQPNSRSVPMGLLDGGMALDPRIPCFVGALYLLCIAVSCGIVYELGRSEGVRVDTVSFTLAVVEWRDERFWNASKHSALVRDSRDGWRDVVDAARPLETDIAHGVSLAWPVIVTVLLVCLFLFMTGRMESESEDGAMRSAYSVENAAISKSSTVVLWTSLFVAGVGAAHVFFVALVVTPAAWERVALVWAALFLPLAVMCQPRPSLLYHSSSPYGALGEQEDGGLQHPIPACGVHPPVGATAVFFAGVWGAAASIQYDPDSYRVQLLCVVAAIDLFVLGLGHLWDSPPSVRTVVNARVTYCLLALSVVAAAYPQVRPLAFPCRALCSARPPDDGPAGGHHEGLRGRVPGRRWRGPGVFKWGGRGAGHTH